MYSSLLFAVVSPGQGAPEFISYLTSNGMHQPVALVFKGPLNCNIWVAWTKPL